MFQVWRYLDATSVWRYGIMLGFTDFGGTDVTYKFHRLGDDGLPIVFDNGGRLVDFASGERLKQANRVGAVKAGAAYIP